MLVQFIALGLILLSAAAFAALNAAAARGWPQRIRSMIALGVVAVLPALAGFMLAAAPYFMAPS